MSHLENAKFSAAHSAPLVNSPDERSIPHLLDGILEALIAIAERLPEGRDAR